MKLMRMIPYFYLLLASVDNLNKSKMADVKLMWKKHVNMSKISEQVKFMMDSASNNLTRGKVKSDADVNQGINCGK